MNLNTNSRRQLSRICRSVLSWALPMLGTVYVLHSLSIEEVRAVTSNVRWLFMVGSLFTMGICFLFLLLNSYLLLDATAGRIPFFRYAQIWFIGNMGKYIPGKVFLALSRASLMKREKIGVPYSMSLLLTENLLLMLSAVIAFFSGNFLMDGNFIFGILVLIVPVFLLAWLVQPFKLILNKAITRISRDAVPVRLSGLAAGLSLTSGSAAWIMYGVSGSLLATGLGLDGVSLFPLFLAMLPFSWLVGFVVLIAPGGIGIREASTVALIEPFVGGFSASTISILLRVLWISVECLGYFLSLIKRMADED